MLNYIEYWKNTQKNRMLVNKKLKYRTFSWENTSPYKTNGVLFVDFNSQEKENEFVVLKFYWMVRILHSIDQGRNV